MRTRKSIKFLILSLIVSILLISACQSANDETGPIFIDDNGGADYAPHIDPANFVDVIDNPYLTYIPGTIWVYEGENEDGVIERTEVKVLAETRVVMGVTVTIVRDTVWEDGILVEDTYDWFAQDKDGNVWYFGEEVKNYVNGQLANTHGAWEAGVDGALPGIIMPASPQIGDAYRQEFWQGEAEDIGQIISLTATVEIEYGTFENCIQTKDWNPFEPSVVEHKYYCKEIGNVVLEKTVAGGTGQAELIEFKK